MTPQLIRTSYVLRVPSPPLPSPPRPRPQVGLALYGVGFSGVAQCLEQGLMAIVAVILFSQVGRGRAGAGRRASQGGVLPYTWWVEGPSLCTPWRHGSFSMFGGAVLPPAWGSVSA